MAAPARAAGRVKARADRDAVQERKREEFMVGEAVAVVGEQGAKFWRAR